VITSCLFINVSVTVITTVMNVSVLSYMLLGTNKLGAGMEVEVTVFVWREGKWFVAYEPTSGMASQGRTVDEALSNIREALELYIEEGEEVYPIERVMITKVKLNLRVAQGRTQAT